jgi:hypothetical protein
MKLLLIERNGNAIWRRGHVTPVHVMRPSGLWQRRFFDIIGLSKKPVFAIFQERK